jgi:L,D-transpeptidase catalytic domain
MRAAHAVAAALIAATVIGSVLVLRGRDAGASATSAVARDLQALPAAPAPALAIGAPTPLRGEQFRSTWTVVRRRIVAHASPDGRSRVLATLALRTTEGTPNLVAVLGRRSDDAGGVWVHVRLPVLPNGSEGWVRRDALAAYEQVRTRLVVDRDRLTATLSRNGRVVFRAPVGIGQARWPTPRGQFTVRSRLTRFASPFYGPLAFGTTARSAVLTDWPGGGFIGIHGTDQPELIPGRVSHGCIRLRNADLLRLARLMPVGTPLAIR